LEFVGRFVNEVDKYGLFEVMEPPKISSAAAE
jgi:hypothetical protein